MTAALIEAHRAAQSEVAATVARRMAVGWRLLDPFDLDNTTERWLAVARRIIGAGRADSTRLAAEYLRLYRMSQLGTLDGFTLDLAPALDGGTTTSLIVTGPVKVKQTIASLVEAGNLNVGIASRAGLVAATGAAARHALNGGRDSIHNTIRRDDQALGYARHCRVNCCSFCAMLASRGPVYESAETATVTGKGRRYHDHCYCQPVPVYDRDAPWPGNSRDLQKLWNESTAGHSGKGAVNAFRRAYERG